MFFDSDRILSGMLFHIFAPKRENEFLKWSVLDDFMYKLLEAEKSCDVIVKIVSIKAKSYVFLLLLHK